MTVVAHLSDGRTITGRLDAWASGWAVIDGRRYDGLVFMRTAS